MARAVESFFRKTFLRGVEEENKGRQVLLSVRDIVV
jgi:hypothetical protein